MIGVQTKLILSAVTGFAGVVAAGLPYRTVVTEYTLCDPRIVTPLKIVILSDYHNDRSDQGTEALGKRVREMNPDLILMPGDMAEEKGQSLQCHCITGTTKWTLCAEGRYIAGHCREADGQAMKIFCSM